MHNITDKDGLVLYKTPAWHGLGEVLQEDITPADALRIAKLDWDVEMIKSPAVVDSLGRTCSSDRHQSAVRMDTGDVLGIHGGRYQPVQNHELFDIAYALGGQVLVESAGSMDEGRKVFVLLRGDTLGLKGNDEAVPYLALSNSHDGSARLAEIPTTVRVVCENTLSLMFQKDSRRMYSVTHNGSVTEKIKSMRKALERFQNDRTNWLNDVTKMQQKTMGHKQTVNFWGGIYERLWGKPVTEEEKDAAAATLGKWEATMETEMASLNYPESDVWIAANAVTQDLQHGDPQRKSAGWEVRRMSSNWFGDNQNKSVSVFQQALGALS